jgi:hypothetical protein
LDLICRIPDIAYLYVSELDQVFLLILEWQHIIANFQPIKELPQRKLTMLFVSRTEMPLDWM